MLRSSLLLSASSIWAVVAQNDASLFDSPVMGYNSYNDIVCEPNEAYMVETIDAMERRGLIEAGYKFFQIDCGWSTYSPERNETTGALKVNFDRFPQGLHWLSDYARSKQMRWSMYSDAGYRMCDPITPSPVAGSLGYEKQDAEFFASMNTEYVKYDNCYVNGVTGADAVDHRPQGGFPQRFGAMWKELQNVGIYGMLICQWAVSYTSPSGEVGPVDWTDEISTSFRLSDDIARGWNNLWRIYNQAIYTLKDDKVGPGHWADADLLEVGEADMTVEEQKTHFAAWALFKSALMISTNITALSDELLQVLLNRDLIEINQNPRFRPIKLVQRWTGDKDLWVGDLQADRSVLLVDTSNTARDLSIDFSSFGIETADVKNLWSGETTPSASVYSAPVGPHGSLPLRLSNIRTSAPANTQYTWLNADSATFANDARILPCSDCGAESSVGYIGGPNNGSITFEDIYTSQETQTVLFNYINADTHFFNRAPPNTNERFASVSVNGAIPVAVSFPKTGYQFEKDVTNDYRVELKGFNTEGKNSITVFYSDKAARDAYGPDLVKIGVPQ